MKKILVEKEAIVPDHIPKTSFGMHIPNNIFKKLVKYCNEDKRMEGRRYKYTTDNKICVVHNDI